MQPPSNKGIYLLLILILILVLISASLTSLQFLNKSSIVPSGKSSDKSSGLEFLDTAGGVVNGKVIQIDNGSLTIENKRGERQVIKASQSLSLTSLPNQTPGTPADLGKIELNKDAMISLILNNGSLEVTSISPVTNSQVPPVAPDNARVASGSGSQTPPPLPSSPPARP